VQQAWVRLHEFLDGHANLFRPNAGRKTDRHTLFPCDLIHPDWPEDIAHMALLMVTGSGWRMPSPRLRFELLDLPLFDSETLSDLPHNAYHDAIALRAYVLERRQSGWL
jgi:hypothetical protein